MSRNDWREWLETIGILAVLASLIALIVELRQTQSALVAATYQARAFDAIRHLEEAAEGEFVLPITTRIDLSDPNARDSLTEVEQQRVLNTLVARMIDNDNEFYQYQNGFLDEEYFEHWLKPSVRFYARQWRAWGVTEFRPSFREFVDATLAEQPGTTSPQN